MKNIKLIAIFVLTLFFTVTSCDNEPIEGDFGQNGNDNEVSCAEATQNLSQISTIYGTTTPDDVNYTVICNDYAVALQNMIDSCGDATGAIQDLLDNLDCPALPDDCSIAITVVASAQAAYESDPTNDTFCLAYKAALQNQITECGDPTGSLQTTINGLSCNETAEVSIVGTWELVAFTVNGETTDVCLGEIEIFTETMYQYQEAFGDNCENLSEVSALEPYTLIGNELTITEDGISYVYEVLELTETTLVYQEEYTDTGEEFVEVHTFERQ
ncbi:lipocalin family protein [Oceanihabitans sediminis]|uniref:Lipocalin-like domain-containing protein n=1 Tax=Oceanihabitans sediminis TaxID=1812012 RepID=A0A368P2L6_9FLAO|nr:lipocalin family protein [Oceanihabitans sediminis]MDX1277715.1 lipocalin family protein [Oceanihabitans sediminis]MDX1774435.1 lipocalin family protein [Oceanihabitans sediminis]RBP27721.1 lipocalin-like protein [Oceanihabitans sediminis]RCU56510.1 hypothetical protein DU428_11460 [Oceanihabitans sediminis]